MSDRARILISAILISSIVGLVIGCTTIGILYRRFYENECNRLSRITQTQAKLIESVSLFDAQYSRDTYPKGATAATLDQVCTAFNKFKAIGKTGELLMARREGNQIIWMFCSNDGEGNNQLPTTCHFEAFPSLHNDSEGNNPSHATLHEPISEPMRRALLGQSGTLIGPDHHGIAVIAAYNPVANTPWGLVAKINLAEFRRPFLQAAGIAVVLVVIVICSGGMLLLRISNPLILRIEENEAYLKAIVDTAADAIIAITQDGRINLFNTAAERMFGYSSQEIIGQNISILMTADDKRRYEEYLRNSFATGRTKTLANGRQLVALRKDGETFPGELSVSEIPFEESSIFIGILRDVTNRNNEERMLLDYQEQLTHMASELAMSEERQRRHISAELHDRIGQTLVATKIKAGLLRNSNCSADATELANDIIQMIDQSMRDVWSLTFELCPPMLYEVGLEAALEWLTKQFQDKHDISCQLKDDGLPKLVSDELRGLLFQAVRELLVNVAKHAHASKVIVSTISEGRNIVIAVEDNGVGIDWPRTNEQERESGGFGLFSIQERLKYFEGVIKIDSKRNRGSRVTIIVPSNKAIESKEDQCEYMHSTC